MAELENKNWFEDFAKASTLDPKTIGYVPIQAPETEEPTGSVYLAHMRQDNPVGAMLNSHTTYKLDEDSEKDYDFTETIKAIPQDLMQYADRFYGARPGEETLTVEKQIRAELKDQSLLAAHPWKALAYGALDPLDPVNWVPGSALYKSIKSGSKVARAMLSTGISTAAAVGASEAVLQQNQHTRTMEQSIFNTAAAGIVGGVLGGIGTGISLRKKLAAAESKRAYRVRQKAINEISDTLADADKELTPQGFLKNEDIVEMPEFVRKSMNFTPMNRLVNSPFATAKWFANSAYEHNYTLVKHTDGITGGASVERTIKQQKGSAAKAIVDYESVFYEMHGISSGPFKATRAKLSGVNMNWDQFDEAASLVLTTQQPHPNPHVNKAAQILRDEIFDPLKDQAIKFGLLPEGVSVQNAVDYFMIMYNKNKIIEQGGRAARGAGTFPQYLFEKFKVAQEVAKNYLATPAVRKHYADIRKLEDKIEGFKKQKERIAPIEKERLKPIEKSIKELKEKIKETKQLIKEQAPAAAKTHDGELHKIDQSDEVLWTNVEQTVDHILGNTDGVLLNPYLERINLGGKPLKKRKLTVDQVGARPWHVTSATKVAQAYTRAMIPAVEMTRFAKEAGFDSLEAMKLGLGARLKAEFDAASVGVTGKAAQKLKKEFEGNVRDMRATFDILMGVYGTGPNVLNNKTNEFYHNFLAWNATRLLGNMTLSSIPDLGLLVIQNGLFKTLHHGLTGIASTAKKMAKKDLQSMGYAMESILGTKIKSFAEHSGLSTEPGVFSRAFDSLTQAFGNLSLMNPWNDMVQAMAGHMGINRILDVIHRVSLGKSVTQKELTKIAKLGIDKDNFEIIYKFTKNNIDERTGVLYADWTNWDVTSPKEIKALKQFQAAVGKEIDNVSIIPGLGDKPLFGRTMAGKFLFQFKSFLMATTNRTLYPSIQNRTDIEVYTGYASMLALGALSYIATSYAKGKEPDLSFSKLSHEALDRSGLLGIWGETFNIGQKVLGFGGVSRYQSRNWYGAVGGPTVGAISEVLGVMNKVKGSISGEDYYTTKDAEKVMRLFPLQNLFYLQQLNKATTNKIATSLGAIPVED